VPLNLIEATSGDETMSGTSSADLFQWDSKDDGNGNSSAPHDIVDNFNEAGGDVLDLTDILDGDRTVIATDNNGDLKLQVVDSGDNSKVYQEITVEGIDFGSSEAESILANLRDHGTSSDS